MEIAMAQWRRRELFAVLGGAAGLLAATRAPAQEPRTLKRIGFLRVGPPPLPWINSLRQGLRELGSIEGRNYVIEFGKATNVSELTDAAAELLRHNVDLIFASGTPPVLAARQATGTIPIVFVAAVDPIGTGLVATLARPGGNITGFTNTQADITGKQLQLLREMLPHVSRIAVIVRANSQANARYVEEAERAARTLGVQLQIVTLQDPRDLAKTFMAAQEAGAVVIPDDAVFTAHRTQIAALAMKHGLPFICSTRELVNAGGLISYGPNTIDLYRHAADYVDKILRGTRPADLPVQQPTQFELIVNLITAKTLGIAIPATILARADAVIE
jgi:putative ABC transport system substrate-binding protein